MAVTQSLSVAEVSGSVNTTANTSKVRILWQSTQSGESWNGYTRTAKYYVSINDGAETEYSVSYTLPQNTTKTIVDTTITVDHNSDGSGTVKVRTWMDTDISAGVVEKTQTVSLTTIPRASTITSASDRTLGKACAVKWTPKSASFRYKLKFTLGDWSYITGAIHPNQTTAYTYTGYTLPLSVANYLPKAKTGTMTVTLYTYSNSSATTQVGNSDSHTFTVTVPDNSSTKPTVTIGLNPVNSSLGDTFSSLYIQGKSKVKATLSAEGKYEATISSYEMRIGSKTYGSPYQSGYLSTSGNVTIKGRAYDSRGYYGEVEDSITVIPYSKPKLLPASGESEIICARCDKDGKLSESGTYLKIKAKRSYSKVTSNGAQNNFCSIRYRYRTDSTNTFSAWKTLLAKTATSDTIDTTLSGVVSSAETAYFVQIGVVDDIGESDAVQVPIPSDFVTVDVPEDRKGKRIGLLRYAKTSDEPGIDVGAPIHGGGVDNLTLGDIITATSSAPIDLNDFKTPGNYYSPNATNSQYITNSPYTAGGFSLIVREIQSASMIRQELFYGRSDWCRHWNGTEWSEWLRKMITSAEEGILGDFVIASGSYDTGYGTWYYKKWASGTYQMFGYFTVTPTESTQRSGGVVYRTNSIGIEAPFDISSACISGTVLGHYWLSNGGISTDHKSIAIRLISDKSISTTEAIEVRLTVMGHYE